MKKSTKAKNSYAKYDDMPCPEPIKTNYAHVNMATFCWCDKCHDKRNK